MAEQIDIEKQIEAEIHALANSYNQKTNIEHEKPTNSDEHTPLRDERVFLRDNMDGTGWESDADTSCDLIRIKQRSPSPNDNELTPLRPSPLYLELDPDPSPEHELGLATEATMPIVKKEERYDLQLGFLDTLSEADFECVPIEYSQASDMDIMELGPRSSEVDALARAREKILNELTDIKPEKKRKKHKKEKKKKRDRTENSEINRKKIRLSESRIKTELDYIPIQEVEKSIKLVNMSKLLAIESVVPPAPPAALSIREKRQLAVERVQAVLSLMRLKASKVVETEFLVVDTVKKLPRHLSFMNSDIFEYPSPLSNNFNVNYKFNSTTTSNINMAKWGLQPMPDITAKLLRLTGIDVTRLMELQQNSKMSLHKLRLKQKAEKAPDDDDNVISTGLFRSVSTQTDRRSDIGTHTRDIGTQAMQISHQGIFWLDPRFTASHLSQQHENVMLALKELCATKPTSSYWAEALYQTLIPALSIRREELKQVSK